jgi:hypothetical protein
MTGGRDLTGDSLLRLGPANAVRGALAAVAACVLLLGGCASVPGPTTDKDSLFVFLSENPAPGTGPEKGTDTLRFKGPSDFTIRPGTETQRGYYVRVKPGRYTADIGDLAAGAALSGASEFEIPPGTVFLYPLKFTRVAGGNSPRLRRLVPLAPEDQKISSTLLTDYFDFQKWFGKAVLGFGAYPPRLPAEPARVEFSVSSTPPGAQLTIDDQAWGVTPVTTRLHVGRHLLRLEIPGVSFARTFVDVPAKGEITIDLPRMPEQEVKDLQERSRKITILLSPFANMGSSENENLRSVFPQVIGSDLRDDSRIVLVDADERVPRAERTPRAPDFAQANRQGTDLIVSGYYTARQDELLVYAALYDVRTQAARASLMYTGKAGLAMFDSIDAMAAQFIGSINAALQDIDTRAAGREAAVEGRTVTAERRIVETATIEKRQAMVRSLTFITGPSVAFIGMIAQPAFPNAILAALPLGLVYDQSLGGPFSLMASIQAALVYDTPGNPNNRSNGAYTSSPYVDIPLRIGPAYTLFGEKADLSFALQGEGRFMIAYFDDTTGGTIYKPVWVLGLGVETTARFYLQSRMSEKPSFFLVGFNWFLMGMQTEIDFTQVHIDPMELALTFGYGFRL